MKQPVRGGCSLDGEEQEERLMLENESDILLRITQSGLCNLR